MNPPSTTLTRRRDRLRTDGGHTSVEVIAWTTTLIAGITLLAQALIAGLGMLACQAAAGNALQATRLAEGTTTAGREAATTVLGQVGGGLRDPQIQVTRTDAASTVTITATALTVLPGVRIPLTATVDGPTEPDLEHP